MILVCHICHVVELALNSFRENTEFMGPQKHIMLADQLSYPETLITGNVCR